MNKTHEKLHNHEKTLITDVISSFRSINSPYNSAHTWYASQLKVSPFSRPTKSTYYIPIFGSVFASALAFIMIITSQNSQAPLESTTFQLKTSSIASEKQEVATFSMVSSELSLQKTEEKQVLAKIDAQTKVISRTQADESFTESLDVETSLKDLFE